MLGSMVPSVSVSFSVMLNVTGTPTSVLALSSVAVGGRLTTSMVILAWFEVSLSLSATV